MASNGRWGNLVPITRLDFYGNVAQTFAAWNHFWSCQKMIAFFSGLFSFRRGPWEMVATIIITLGVFMLMQPFVMWAFTYSFITTLIGTVMFIVVSHFRE